jgi:hypothetical protein
MDRYAIDTIARMLDARTNRRRATRGVLGVLLGGAAIGSTRFGAAARKRGKGREKSRRVHQESGGRGNSACAHFCNAVFPSGRHRGQCKSEGARHTPGNLCDACETNVDRFCDGLCCAAGEECDGGVCQGVCGGETCTEDECCDGAVCQPGGTWAQCRGSDSSCEACAVEEVCPGGSQGCHACANQTGSTACDGVLGPSAPSPDIQCGPGDTFFCTCAERADGEGGACIGNVFGCSEIEPTCFTNVDCDRLFPDTGWVCVRKGSCAGVAGCLGDNICADPCDTAVDATRRRAGARARIVFAD